MKRVNRGLLVVASGTCTEDVPHSSPLQRLQVEGYRQLSLVSINSMDGFDQSNQMLPYLKTRPRICTRPWCLAWPCKTRNMLGPGMRDQISIITCAINARDFEAFHRFQCEIPKPGLDAYEYYIDSQDR